MATLWGGATPAGAQFLDGSPGIKVGLTLNFSGAGQVTELWWYCGAQTGGTWTLTMWDITTGDASSSGAGTQLASQAFSGTPTANAWNKVVLSAAQNVLGGNKRYRVAVHNGQYYWTNNGYFNAHDEVNGPISALRSGDSSSPLGVINQGTFLVSSSATAYPTQTGSQANYPVDVTFIPSGIPFTRDYSDTWRVFNPLTRDYASTWRVFNSLTRDYVSSWRVFNGFTTDYTSSWRVFNAFVRDYASTWDVLSGTAFVRDYQSTWRVYNSFAVDNSSTWRVYNAFARDYASTWRVLATFTRDYSGTWRVFNGFIRDYTSTWAVLSDTPTGLVMQVWSGGVLIAVSSISVWNGTDEIPAELEQIVGL